jgi:peptidoglycan/xylan/chitin deacetylase (PgdA/CDA1 family)
MRIPGSQLNKVLKALIGRMAFKSGLYRHLLSETAIVVVFHRVHAGAESDDMALSMAEFQSYCTFFKRYFNVVPLRTMVEQMKCGSIQQLQLAITLDDGYMDNYEFAAPILKSLGLPATFFVVTQYIGTEVVPWWDLKANTVYPWMTRDQVLWLYRQDFDIGSHTRTHADLGVIAGNQAAQEILGARHDLEALLGGTIDLFAYPYGGVSNMTEANRALIREAGYGCCCSAYGGINYKDTDPLRLRRMGVSSWYLSPYHFFGDLLVWVWRDGVIPTVRGLARPRRSAYR